MNYLAHALLAEPEHERLIGNLAGDFLKGPLDDLGLSPGLRAGVQLHRRIDRYTDEHPVTVELRGLFAGRYRRFAGIILDIVFDHALSQYWTRFASQPRREFIDEVYAVIGRHSNLLPGRFSRVAPRMVAGDWLGAYAHRAGVDAALRGISRRLSRENPLASAMPEVDRLYADIETGFLRLFPETLEYCRRHSASHDPDC